MSNTTNTSKSSTSTTDAVVAHFSKGERLEAFNIKETSKKSKLFVRVGTAWVNKDGSLNLVLDAVPLDGKVHIRRPVERLDGGKSEVPSQEDAAF